MIERGTSRFKAVNLSGFVKASTLKVSKTSQDLGLILYVIRNLATLGSWPQRLACNDKGDRVDFFYCNG